MKILVLNSGSSSLKYQVIDTETGEMLVKGYYERIGQVGAFLTHKVNGEKHHFEHPAKNHEKAIQFVMKRLTSDHYGVFKSLDELDAIGHRVVHGGEQFKDAVLITDEVIQEIKENAMLAPLHNPAAVLGMEACRKVVPNVKMVAVFDTAFHQSMPEENYIFPLPYEYYTNDKVRRYGAHGTSHEYLTKRLAELQGKTQEEMNIITCHLGNGASITAVKNGKSYKTSMGFTPLGGIMMGTRCGDIDPTVVFYMEEKLHATPEDMDNYLNKKSGMLGVSGISSDCRDIEAAYSKGDERAVRTINLYINRIVNVVGGYFAQLGHVDAIAFTAGIGENDSLVREKVCQGLEECMGLSVDYEANRNCHGEELVISKKDSKVDVVVCPTNEELVIARDTVRILGL